MSLQNRGEEGDDYDRDGDVGVVVGGGGDDGDGGERQNTFLGWF